MKDIINSFKDQKLFFELYYARQSAEQFQSYPSLKSLKKKNKKITHLNLQGRGSGHGLHTNKSLVK